jgi:hypothetical protein
MHRSIPALVFFAALAGSSQTTPAVKPVSHTTKSTAISSRSMAADRSAQGDAELERAIRARFAKSKIAVDKFEVHVQGGRATIEGSTNVLQHKGVATRLARAVGATEVVNKIRPSDQAKEKAKANLEKGRRRAQVKRAEARSER